MPDPETFCRHWLAAWNGHDLGAVLAHFDENVVFTSPIAAQLVAGSQGVLRGKAALAAYWTEGLRRIPDLRFTIDAIYAGVDTLVIQYRNQKGVAVSEVLRFEGGLVKEGHGTYAVGAVNPAGVKG